MSLLKTVEDPEKLAAAFGLSYELQDEEVLTRTALDHALSIRNLFPELETILAKFEVVIRKRWDKKTEEARKGVLKQAWPDMPPLHRPDLSHLREGSENGACRRCFLYPHINVEDLIKGKTFLRLLNSRGRNEPAAFALLDLDALQIGLRSKQFPFAFIPKFMGFWKNVPSEYGLIYCKSGHELFVTRTILGGRHPAASDGMLVIEVQARILTFLRDCCRIILHDRLSEIDDDKMPVGPVPEALPAHDEPADSLVWEALQRPYRAPGDTVDLQKMLDQAKAALEEAQEHVWALREDPSYFATAVTDWKDHSVALFKDFLGRHHADVDLPQKGFLTVRLLAMLKEAYRAVFEWEMIITLLEEFVQTQPLS
ncbi:hypothetical protein C8A00DRAFT_18626 [Chaetomidium leptoderma]|uniref:Uncharacterized protein n=1 Tax=Chaetomidium leptoderma TaxID=669021 RepID=A0AAN6VEA1_9PEZI|nr:hypothetical protein C8A00DRAFT_18626 [Chaetomidium leptoderma]